MTTVNIRLKTYYAERPLTIRALAYLAAITLAELLVTYGDPRLGMLAHCLLLLVLFANFARVESPQERALLVGLTFAPLIRIISLALPLTEFPPLYWYLITSVPLFVAVLVAAQALGLSWPRLGLTLRRWPWQLAIGATGLAFGALEYFILRPEPMTTDFTWAGLLWPVLILIISTGLLEEMIFRGLLQTAALDALGGWALFYVALVFAALHIGYRSVVEVLFVLGVGLFLGWAVFRTGSLLGATLAHGLTNVVLFLVMPYLALKNIIPSFDSIGQVPAAPGLLQVLPLVVVLLTRRRAFSVRRAQLRARLTGPAGAPSRRWMVPGIRASFIRGIRPPSKPLMRPPAIAPRPELSRRVTAALEPRVAGSVEPEPSPGTAPSPSRANRWLNGRLPSPSAQPALEPAQARRLLVAAVGLVAVRLMRLWWPDPNLAGALTVVEPLLIVWPFVTPIIPLPCADYAVGGAFYALLLLFGAVWRVSERSAAYAIAFDPTVIWMALTLTAAVIGQVLLGVGQLPLGIGQQELGRQRLVLLRLALVLLSLGAVLAAIDMQEAAGLVTLLGGLLVFIKILFVLRAPQPRTRPAPATARATRPARPAALGAPGSAVATPQPADYGPPAPRPRYLYEKRQLLSMRLASIVAYNGLALPELLNEMLSTFGDILPAELSAVLLAHDEPSPSLVLAGRYETAQPGVVMSPATLDEAQAPALFEALRRGRKVEGKVGVEVKDALGLEGSGPVLLWPIVRGERVYGLLVVGNPISWRTIDEENCPLCQVMSARLGAAIARYNGLNGFPLITDNDTDTHPKATGPAAAISTA
jgi:hypothetical protein